MTSETVHRSTNDPLRLYFEMLRIRRVEEALAERYAEQQMRCPMHLSIGQEACAVGVCAALSTNDIVYSGHRAHAHFLAKGGSLTAMVAELYGRTTGCCGGRGGSMHLVDLQSGFGGSTPIVGGTVPIAVGTAWAFQRRKEAHIAVAFFGDGCFEEGVVHECLNFAALKQLPLLFICENNGYSVYTKLSERQPARAITSVARAHTWQTWTTDGNDVLAVAEVAAQAAEQARTGNGPQFVELVTHRWREHCGPNDDDGLGYRDPGELAAWRHKCPLQQLRDRITHRALLSDAELEQMETRIAFEINSALSVALNDPFPSPETLSQYLYAGTL